MCPFLALTTPLLMMCPFFALLLALVMSTFLALTTRTCLMYLFPVLLFLFPPFLVRLFDRRQPRCFCLPLSPSLLLPLSSLPLLLLQLQTLRRLAPAVPSENKTHTHTHRRNHTHRVEDGVRRSNQQDILTDKNSSNHKQTHSPHMGGSTPSGTRSGECTTLLSTESSRANYHRNKIQHHNSTIPPSPNDPRNFPIETMIRVYHHVDRIFTQGSLTTKSNTTTL